MTFAGRALLFLLVFGAFSVSVYPGDVYQWTDENGKNHFGDRPPADSRSKPVELRINTYNAPTIIPTRSSKSLSRGKSKRVIMYSASWCGICKQARAYFKANKIQFLELDVEKSARGKKDFQRLGGSGVPIILVGDQRINGFSPNTFRKMYR